VDKDPFFAESETPSFLGRAIAALAADPEVGQRAGAAYFTADLARDYGFTDIDGHVPAFWPPVEAALDQHFEEHGEFKAEFHGLARHRYAQIHREPARQETAERLRSRLGLEDLGAGLRPLAAGLGK
jgi:hypothetical protein